LAALLPVAGLPLAAQPKPLVNATVDNRSAAAGLEREFRSLLLAEPQPAWIGYLVPAVRVDGLGCELVNRDGASVAGVVHLEPPGHAVILFRVVANAVERIRALSPDCEIDAGGVPVHWLNDVPPAQSVALLDTFATGGLAGATSAVRAIAMHSDPAADAALDRYLAPSQPEPIRLRAVSLMGSTRGRRGFEALKNLIADDPNQRVRERAITALASSREPEAADLLVATARDDRDQRVQRRAISALGSLPAGQGVAPLIDPVKTAKNAEIRKAAMSALGSTRDPRAVAFFEQVLKQ
jgi:hypothetical protein